MISELHTRLGRTLAEAGLTYELVFVDDACPEGSGRIVEQLRHHDPHVRLVSLSRNVGQHAAVLEGLRRSRGSWTVVMDADLQDPPDAIPCLLEIGRELGVPVVFAGRRGRYESEVRLFTSRIFKRALSAVAGVPPDAGLFVALSRAVVDRLLELDGRRPYLTAMIGCSGFAVVSVPVVRAQRPSGSSAYRLHDRLASGMRAFAWVAGWRVRTLLGRG